MDNTIAEFNHAISSAGYMVFDGMVPGPMLAALRVDIPNRVEVCGEWQRRNGVGDGMAGVAHHVVGGEDSLNDFLCAFFLDTYIRAYFGGEYILNSYGAVNNLPCSLDTYKHGHRFHRDIRTYSGNFRLMLNMLVMVHDFTIENGATKLVPGSHKVEERPDDAELEARSVRVVGSAGCIVLFDSNLWHSAAPNTTSGPRMALTLTFSRPFLKQQMDYPRLLGENFPKNERIRQLLGYNARVPANHDEWYQPSEKRMYRPGQG
jgi:hypothetical protein